MPVVKGKHFAYTAAGKKAASNYAKKTKAKPTGMQSKARGSSKKKAK